MICISQRVSEARRCVLSVFFPLIFPGAAVHALLYPFMQAYRWRIVIGFSPFTHPDLLPFSRGNTPALQIFQVT